MAFGTKKKVIEISYNDLTERAQALYGHDPEVVASEEWNNDEEHSFEIDGALDTWDEEALTKFKETGHAGYGITGLLLNDMARQGLIEKGAYLVSICW